MPNDPTRPLLRLNQEAPIRRAKGKPRRLPLPPSYPIERQRNEIGPKLDALARALARGDDPLTLRNDPDALAPECLIVFEIKGPCAADLIDASRPQQSYSLKSMVYPNCGPRGPWDHRRQYRPGPCPESDALRLEYP